MNKVLAITTALALGYLVLVAPARAAEVQGPTQVVASVPGSCSVASVSDISFGQYDASGPNHATTAHKDVIGTFRVRCNKSSLGGAVMRLSLGPGQNHEGAGCFSRRMANGEGGFLRYDVYTSATRTTATRWGCPASGGMVSGVYDSGADHIFTMYARLPGGQSDASAGQYTDNMEILISF